MMRKSLTVSLALAGAALAYASPAFAQDGRAPFAGLYIGGSVGAAVQPNDVGSSTLFDTNQDGNFGDTVNFFGSDAFAPGFCNGRANGATPEEGCRNDKDGVEYAARVGFDKQAGQVVFGIVGEFGKAKINDSVSAFSSEEGEGTIENSYTMTRSLRYNAALRARLGYVAGASTLFYATGGGAYGRIRNRFYTTDLSNDIQTNGSHNAYGYSVGGGVEQKLGEHLSLGLEYIYTDLKDNKARAAVSGLQSNLITIDAIQAAALVTGPGDTEFRRSDDRFRWHSIRATVAFRF